MLHRMHYHHTLRPYPHNIVHMRRMDGRGKIHHTTERIHPHGYLEILKQVGNGYGVVHRIHLRRHHNMHPVGRSHTVHGGSIHNNQVSSSQLLKKIYQGFGRSKSLRKL